MLFPIKDIIGIYFLCGEHVENPSKCVDGDNDLKRSCDKNVNSKRINENNYLLQKARELVLTVFSLPVL